MQCHCQMVAINRHYKKTFTLYSCIRLTGQAVPKVPRLPAVYDSKEVISVEVDKRQSTCTDINGLKQNCLQITGGSIPSPNWADGTADPADYLSDNSTDNSTSAVNVMNIMNTVNIMNTTNDTLNYCENVVSKVCTLHCIQLHTNFSP